MMVVSDNSNQDKTGAHMVISVEVDNHSSNPHHIENELNVRHTRSRSRSRSRSTNSSPVPSVAINTNTSTPSLSLPSPSSHPVLDGVLSARRTQSNVTQLRRQTNSRGNGRSRNTRNRRGEGSDNRTNRTHSSQYDPRANHSSIPFTEQIEGQSWSDDTHENVYVVHHRDDTNSSNTNSGRKRRRTDHTPYPNGMNEQDPFQPIPMPIMLERRISDDFRDREIIQARRRSSTSVPPPPYSQPSSPSFTHVVVLDSHSMPLAQLSHPAYTVPISPSSTQPHATIRYLTPVTPLQNNPNLSHIPVTVNMNGSSNRSRTRSQKRGQKRKPPVVSDNTQITVSVHPPNHRGRKSSSNKNRRNRGSISKQKVSDSDTLTAPGSALAGSDSPATLAGLATPHIPIPTHKVRTPYNSTAYIFSTQPVDDHDISLPFAGSEYGSMATKVAKNKKSLAQLKNAMKRDQSSSSLSSITNDANSDTRSVHSADFDYVNEDDPLDEDGVEEMEIESDANNNRTNSRRSSRGRRRRSAGVKRGGKTNGQNDHSIEHPVNSSSSAQKSRSRKGVRRSSAGEGETRNTYRTRSSQGQ